MNLTVALTMMAGLLVVWMLTSMFLPRKFATAVKAVLLLVVAGAAVLQTALWSSSAFRVAFDATFHPMSEHVVLHTGGGTLPLPPKTALRYRYSEEGAVYYTRRTAAQITDFYDQLTVTGISTAHVFNRFLGRDQRLDSTVPGDAPEIARFAALLQDVEWLTDNTIVKLPVPVPGGPPAITLTYTDGRTVSIQLAYRCQPSPPNCQQVPDAVMVGDQPARSAVLATYILNGSSATQR